VKRDLNKQERQNNDCSKNEMAQHVLRNYLRKPNHPWWKDKH